jgi:hypothetical protein
MFIVVLYVDILPPVCYVAVQRDTLLSLDEEVIIDLYRSRNLNDA